MQRIVGLGLLELPSRGPYGTHVYSPLPRARYDSSASRTALRDRADAWALAMRPVLDGLREAGFIKHDAIAAELNRRAIAPQRSGLWSTNMVKHLLYRMKEMEERDAR